MKLEFEYTENKIDDFGLNLKKELKQSFSRLGDDSINLVFDSIMKALTKEAAHQDNELIKINFKGIEDKKVVDFNFANDPSKVFTSVKESLTDSLHEKIDAKTIDNIFNLLTAHCEHTAQQIIDNKDKFQAEKEATMDNIKNLKLRSEYKSQSEKSNSLSI